jgi:hypothetical protein
MAAELLSILDELNSSRLYSSAILSTYGFDGTFFEEDVLPVLNQLDISNIVVLTDTDSYRDIDTVTKAGQAYYIDHVRCPKIHHPKFVALFGRDYGRVFVGSANLTKTGWQQSGELMTVIDHPPAPERADAAPLFAQLRDFIEHSQSRIHSSHATDAIDDAFSDAPWLPAASAAEPAADVNLLHNYTEPLLPQLREHIGDTSIETIEICSPFFSGGNTEPLEELCELDPAQISVNLQPNKVEGFKADVFDAPAFADIDITVNEIALTGDDEDRYLHAKLLLLSGPDGSWAFYGSPNFTKSALLQTGDVGNVELGVLRHDPDPEYFGYLLDADTVTREAMSPESVEYHPPSSHDPDTEAPDFQLTDAYLDADGTLLIDHEPTAESPQKATITLSRAASDEDLVIEESPSEAGHLRSQDERISQFCEQAVRVRATLEFATETRTSDARWVALPSLKQTPRASEIQAIESSEGREGLLDVLDRLPTWGLICKFLENVDFRTTSVGGGGGRTIRSRTPGTDDRGGLEEWSPPDRSELLKSKVNTLHNRLDATHGDLLLDPTDPERFESFVNQYVALSKLVLWWDSQDLSTLSHLAEIRVAADTMGEFVGRLSTHPQAKAAQALDEEHALFEHVVITMRYVDELQRRAGYNTGVNENVYRVFQETNRDVLEAFADLREQSTPDHEKLADVLEEYAAIDAVSVTPGQVKQYCQDLREGSG